jgi:AcrR family transcriptional regulator
MISKRKSRKEIEVETRRRLIVDAARQLLTTKDIEATSMDEIAAAVDYTRRTLYAYFKSRDEILLLLLCEDLAQRWMEQQQGIAQAATGHDKLMSWGRMLFAFSRANPHAVRLQAYWDYRGIDREKIGDDVANEFEDLNNELADGLREIFRLGVADGSLRPDLETDLCISQLLYSLRIVIHRALSSKYSFATFDPEQYVEHYLNLFSRAIRHQEVKT